LSLPESRLRDKRILKRPQRHKEHKEQKEFISLCALCVFVVEIIAYRRFGQGQALPLQF
jgi:hypothetical protein